MRTYLKSLSSFSWILSLFGLKQLGELLMSPLRRRRAETEVSRLEALTRSFEEHLGPTFQAIFRSGDRILQGVMGLAMGRTRRSPAAGTEAPPWHAEDPEPPVPPSTGPSPSGSPRSPQAVSGWGPMPPIPEPPATAGPTGRRA